VQEQGPTNVFLRVDGAAEQQLFLPLGYKWVVWDHTDTTVRLTKGTHTIALAARSLDGSKATRGDAILDRITLSLPNPVATTQTYEAELADLRNSLPVYGLPRRVSGSGDVALPRGGAATFWVYSKADAESVLDLKVAAGSVRMAVNGIDVPAGKPVAVSLSGGVNKVTVTGTGLGALIDKLDVRPGAGALKATTLEAESATPTGTATAAARPLAGGGAAVTGITGDNTLTFSVPVDQTGTYALRIRYANPEQADATHYNPDPLARHADIAVNGGAAKRVLFPHTFHADNFCELTVPVQLKRGANTIRFSSAELPDFDGDTYASDTWPGILLRSKYAPDVDNVTVAPFAKALPGR
jgi:hypothetical protein